MLYLPSITTLQAKAESRKRCAPNANGTPTCREPDLLFAESSLLQEAEPFLTLMRDSIITKFDMLPLM